MGRDEDTGRFQPEYPDKEFVEAVRSIEAPATTQEVADTVGCNNVTANRRLKSIAEAGKLDRMNKTGVILWSVPK